MTLIGAQVEQDPELGLDAVALEQVEDDPRLAVQLAGRDPEGVERDAVPLERVDLGVEGGDVLGAPVVGEMLEPQLLEHGRAIFGPALLAVERDDAPGDQVVAGEEALRGLGRSALGGRRRGPAWPSAGRCAQSVVDVTEHEQRTRHDSKLHASDDLVAARSGWSDRQASSCRYIEN